MTLHEAIKDLLSESGHPMTTTEIADMINARRSYIKRDGSAVSPFQIHGRTRNYPSLFSRSGSFVSLVQWVDPAPQPDGGSGLTIEASRLGTAEILVPRPGESRDVQALFNSGVFRPAGMVDSEVPNQAGLYAIRVEDRATLPEPFGSLSYQRGHDLLYVGIARHSLSRRLLDQELRAKGHGTFFRSIGAVLGYSPPAGSLSDKTNTKNYTFALADKQAIIAWINQNLLVNWVVLSGNHRVEERLLIRERQPLLNIQDNPVVLPELLALRAVCIRTARGMLPG